MPEFLDRLRAELEARWSDPRRRLMLIAAAGGVVILLLAAAWLLLSGPETSAPETQTAQAPQPGAVCVRDGVELFEGMAAGCLAPGALAALEDSAVLDFDGRPVEVSLVSDEDPDSAAQPVRTCDDYEHLTANGWYPLAQTDMRRQAFFERSCGALRILRKGAAAKRSNFTNHAATEADIASILPTDLPSFTPKTPDPQPQNAAIENLRADGSGRWRLSASGTDYRIEEIAAADFNGDGLEDLLVFVGYRAQGGSAAAGSVGYLQKATADGPVRLSRE